MGQVKNFEARVFRALRREPPQSKVHRLAFWLLIIYLALMPFRLLPGTAGAIFSAFRYVHAHPAPGFLCPAALALDRRTLPLETAQPAHHDVLVDGPDAGGAVYTCWRLIALYGFSGQFAIFAATSAIEAQMEHYGAENRAFSVHVSHFLATHPESKSVSPPPEMEDTAPGSADTSLRIAAFQDGKLLPITPRDPAGYRNNPDAFLGQRRVPRGRVR